MERLRGRVGKVDAEILRLVKRRLELAEEIGREKRMNALPVVDPAAERRVIDRASALSSELGLDADFSRRLMGLLIEESTRIQNIERKGRRDGE